LGAVTQPPLELLRHVIKLRGVPGQEYAGARARAREKCFAAVPSRFWPDRVTTRPALRWRNNSGDAGVQIIAQRAGEMEAISQPA